MTEKKNETVLDVVQWWTRYALLAVMIVCLFMILYPSWQPIKPPTPPEWRCILALRSAMRGYYGEYGRLPAGTTTQIIRQLEPFSDMNREGKSNFLEQCITEHFSEIAFSALPLPDEMVRDQSIRVAAYIHVKGKAPNFVYVIDNTFSPHAGDLKDPKHVPAEQLLDRHIQDVIRDIASPLTH